MSIKPEDILADEVSSREINGVNIRKGSVAAVLANADVLSSETATEAEKADAIRTIKELAPAIVALNMHKHVSWRNPAIQKIIDELV